VILRRQYPAALLQRSTVIVATDRHFNHASLSVRACGSTLGFWRQLADPRTFSRCTSESVSLRG
jgi:hypothetical protein